MNAAPLQLPLVSVCCITYNHAPYIRECLDGFILQQTNFPIEVLIYDDASTDGAQNIIREYEAKYPDIIKPIYQTENQYSKGCKVNREFNFSRAQGKYIALCEGDDYWTDPLKLQKQVDFLEANPEYSMCFHNATVKSEDGDKPNQPFSNIEDRDYSGVEIFEKWTVPTASVVFRKDVVKSNLYKIGSSDAKFCFGDIVLFLSCAASGKLRALKDCMSVYRRHKGGAIYSFSYDGKIKMLIHQRNIPKVFGSDYIKASKCIIAGACSNDAIYHFRSKEYNKALWMWQFGMSNAPIETVKTFTNRAVKFLKKRR